ncbi:MAG: diguanylate cyclase [Candidatus Acidiferrales bacterium]
MVYQLGGRIARQRWLLVLAAGVAVLGLVAWWQRSAAFSADPLLYGYADVAGSLIAFTYAANMLVRFRGTHDRISLIFAFAFLVTGFIELGSGFLFHERFAGVAADVQAPAAWMIAPTLLAVLLLSALVVERHLPNARNPGREIGGAFLAVGVMAYLTAALFIRGFASMPVDAAAIVPRPWQLLPAALFFGASIGYWKRLRTADSWCDRAIFLAVAIHCVCHVLASQSVSLLSAPFAAAQALKVASYAVVLGGALLDNARLFDQVRHLAISDPLTGLANYRRFVDALEAEIRRSQRTRRTFALVLLDLDGLKKINDSMGHLVGTRAISRVARTLKMHCRAIDMAARYGGDEFALVLPEAGPDAARQVADRIALRLANDGEHPTLSASIGIAIYPFDGETVERLLSVADSGLYQMKGKRKRKAKLPAAASL